MFSVGVVFRSSIFIFILTGEGGGEEGAAAR